MPDGKRRNVKKIHLHQVATKAVKRSNNPAVHYVYWRDFDIMATSTKEAT